MRVCLKEHWAGELGRERAQGAGNQNPLRLDRGDAPRPSDGRGIKGEGGRRQGEVSIPRLRTSDFAYRTLSEVPLGMLEFRRP